MLVFCQSDLQCSFGLTSVHSITILAGDLVHNTLLPLLRYLRFYSHYLLQGASSGKDIADVEGGTYPLESLTESTDIRGVQGPSWFGELRVFSVWHFWGGGQRLLHQVGRETICLENLVEML